MSILGSKMYNHGIGCGKYNLNSKVPIPNLSKIHLTYDYTNTSYYPYYTTSNYHQKSFISFVDGESLFVQVYSSKNIMKFNPDLSVAWTHTGTDVGKIIGIDKNDNVYYWNNTFTAIIVLNSSGTQVASYSVTSSSYDVSCVDYDGIVYHMVGNVNRYNPIAGTTLTQLSTSGMSSGSQWAIAVDRTKKVFIATNNDFKCVDANTNTILWAKSTVSTDGITRFAIDQFNISSNLILGWSAGGYYRLYNATTGAKLAEETASASFGMFALRNNIAYFMKSDNKLYANDGTSTIAVNVNEALVNGTIELLFTKSNKVYTSYDPNGSSGNIKKGQLYQQIIA